MRWWGKTQLNRWYSFLPLAVTFGYNAWFGFHASYNKLIASLSLYAVIHPFSYVCACLCMCICVCTDLILQCFPVSILTLILGLMLLVFLDCNTCTLSFFLSVLLFEKLNSFILLSYWLCSLYLISTYDMIFFCCSLIRKSYLSCFFSLPVDFKNPFSFDQSLTCLHHKSFLNPNSAQLTFMFWHHCSIHYPPVTCNLFVMRKIS